MKSIRYSRYTGEDFGLTAEDLPEDLTGKGHTTRVVSSEPVLTAVIPLAEPAH